MQLNTPRAQARRATQRAPITLDEARFAAVLNDPCNAPLARPVYPTTGSGFLQRFEADYVVGSDGGSTCGAVAFAPGCLINGGYAGYTQLTSANVNNAMYLAKVGGPAMPDTDTAACDWRVLGASQSAGQLFLGANAGAARPVACCLQVYWPGAELSRQGFVSLFRGQPSDLGVQTGNNPTVAQLRAASPLVMRTPQDKAEVKWQPEEGDTAFASVNTQASVAWNRLVNGSLGMVGCTWSGFPANVGVRIRLVVVYEWLPIISTNSGVVMDSGSAPSTHGTLQRVMEWLRSRDPQWYLQRGRDVAAFLQRSQTLRNPRLQYHDEL